MFTIAQSSYWSALHLGDSGLEAMKERGRLQVGKVADITILSQTITDNSAFKIGEHGIPSTGIPYVVVNGIIVVKDSEVLRETRARNSFPVEPKGRFKPIEVGGWLNKHTIGLNPDLVKVKLHDDTGAGSKLLHQCE